MSRKLLFLVTEDWYFCSHRLPPARAAREAGFSVVVATRVNRHGDAITREGFKLLPIGLRRRSANPIRELAAIVEIVRIYFRERPDVVHHVAIKPALYGSIAARVARVPGVVNAFAGLGFIFTAQTVRARIFRTLLVRLFRLVLNTRRAVLIMQNPDDTALVAGRMVAPERIRLIRSSGVDLDRFAPSAEPAGTPVVMLASRMLWNKGLREFVEAATALKSRNARARFVLVGESDLENPAAVPLAQL
jgi:glycosyltransferase involved in cell wall biosynthesis